MGRKTSSGGHVGRGERAGRAGRTPKRARRLAASAFACALSCMLAFGATMVSAVAEGEGPSLSAGGSSFGIRLVAQSPDDPNSVRNDSNLGIRLTSAPPAASVEAEFLSQGSLFYRTVAYMDSIVPPPSWEPAWSWEASELHGADEAAYQGGAPEFDRWYADAAWTRPFDATAALTASMLDADGKLRVHAGWNIGEKVTVTLDSGVADGFGEGVRTQDVARYWTEGKSSLYKELPVPARVGHEFRGWWTKDGADGDWGIQATPETRLVSSSAHALHAKWEPVRYTLRYVNNVPHGSGSGATFEQEVTWGERQSVMTWDEVVAAARDEGKAFAEASGCAFDGWYTLPDAYADADKAGSWTSGTLVHDLRDTPGTVTLYAQWKSGVATERPHVTFVYGNGTDPDLTVEVDKDAMVEEPETPKRKGYSFSGWYADLADDSTKWGFSSGVHESITLYAKWDMRLDVTVPVSVAFAVDAASTEVTTPDMGKFKIKSRTVAPVVVESVASVTNRGELRGFFALAEEEGGDWTPSVKGTKIWVWTKSDYGMGSDLERDDPDEKADPRGIAIALADEGAAAGADRWANRVDATDDQRGHFTVERFSYGLLPDPGAGAWQGGGDLDCRLLELKFGMRVSPSLSVSPALKGGGTLTHLVFTVSATQTQ